MRLSIFNRHPRAELSAYLDGELIPLRIEAMQAHLASCQSCRAELEALRQLKAGLAALPEMPAPRSFALTPQMAARPVRERPRASVPPRAAALANGMRLAGAAMTLALALVLVLDFTGSGTTSDSESNLTAARHTGDRHGIRQRQLTRIELSARRAPAADSGDLALTPTPHLRRPTSLPGGVSTNQRPGGFVGSGSRATTRRAPAQ